MGNRFYCSLYRASRTCLVGRIVLFTMMTKTLTLLVLICCMTPLMATHDQTVEIDLTGLSCSFCVYGLKKNLEKHAEIDKAEISLKQNKARIHLTPEAKLTTEEIRQIITDAGFASGELQHYGRAEHPCETAAC